MVASTDVLAAAVFNDFTATDVVVAAVITDFSVACFKFAVVYIT